MWNFFKGSQPQTNYEVQGEKLSEVSIQNKCLFEVFDGKKKSSTLATPTPGPDVATIFMCESTSPSILDLAKTVVKKLKTLKHPSVLTFIESYETDKVVYLVTEWVRPLAAYLDEQVRSDRGPKRDFNLAWGIFQVTRGLDFLINDAKLKHNNIHCASIFVNASGEWKMAGLEYVNSVDSQARVNKAFPELEKYNPPEWGDPAKQQLSTPYSNDVWGLGCLVWEVFNGPLTAPKNLANMGDIPNALRPVYMELVAARPNKRPNPKELILKLRKSGGYFKNDLIDVILFLEEIQIKDESEKSRFYSSLSPLLDNFPANVAKNKILPQLISAFEFGNAGSSILGPVFKIGKHLETEEYQEKIIPCLVKLFASSDRNARYKLLCQIENFVEHLSDKVVNDKVFPQLQTGFLDKEPVIREKSVISMIYLATKLNYSNLDETVVLKHFARTLRDDHAGIRTNTTVCLGKIARHLHYSTRQKVLLGAFSSKLKDPFPPARIAAINAFAATQQFYTIQETAGRVLPALCGALTDPEKPVREQAFKVVRGFLEKLEKVSEDPTLKEEMESEVKSTSAVLNTATTWASWAVGAIGAKFYKSAEKPPAPQTASTSASPADSPASAKPASAKLNPSKAVAKKEEKINDFGDRSSGLGDWNDDADDQAWDDLEPASKSSGWDQDDGWNDAGDDWGAMEDKTEPIKPDPVESTASSSRRGVSKLSVQDEDDWTDDWLTEKPAVTSSAASRAAQRRAANQNRERKPKAGPMKLGSKLH